MSWLTGLLYSSTNACLLSLYLNYVLVVICLTNERGGYLSSQPSRGHLIMDIFTLLINRQRVGTYYLMLFQRGSTDSLLILKPPTRSFDETFAKTLASILCRSHPALRKRQQSTHTYIWKKSATIESYPLQQNVYHKLPSPVPNFLHPPLFLMACVASYNNQRFSPKREPKVCKYVSDCVWLCKSKGTPQRLYPWWRTQESAMGKTYKKKIIRTPNILAISHLLLDTRFQYLRSSRCAPSTLSTTSSVLASMRWIISLCSDTMVASCPKMLPSSPIVFSIASIASPRCWMYVLDGCASSIINSCWSPTGLSERVS